MSYSFLRSSVGLLDLSRRGRLCLTGQDRIAFLHGQVTNHVKRLAPGQGCYAALVNNKGKLQSDLNLYILPEECLLDFEPGLTDALRNRLEQFIIADDVQVLDAAPHYGMLTMQGPRAREVAAGLAPAFDPPAAAFAFAVIPHPEWGELYLMNRPRGAALGFDLFVPAAAQSAAAAWLAEAARRAGGGWTDAAAMETVRIEAGQPRFGADGDMDETNLAPEAGLDATAISYDKGCYIGQEVIARIRTYGQVAKSLRGLLIDPGLGSLPVKGEPLWHGDRQVGYCTTAAHSPALGRPVALGYVRKQHHDTGARLELRRDSTASPVQVADLPFVNFHFDLQGKSNAL